jgi:hypothetical protein
MEKKKMNIQSLLLLLLFASFTNHSNSQELFTKELKWNPSDSIAKLVFQNTDQIIEWGKNIGPLVSVQSEKLCIRNCNVFILKVDICSGIYCPIIYIFEERKKLWQLITSTQARLKEQIEIDVDDKTEKLIFKTKSSQIGELSFETLNLNSDKSEQ